jgi:CDP-glycerol glycerophosphotransferase (TagB/SpsB family)
MSKFKKIKKVIKGLFYYFVRHVISLSVSLFIRRSKSMWVFGSYGCKNFFQNSKYLFLYVNLHEPDINAIWISKNEAIISTLRENGYKAYHKRSFKGLYYSFRAKYYIADWGMDCINNVSSVGAYFIALWHGVSLKKLENDIDNEIQKKIISSFEHKLFIQNVFGRPKMMISAAEYDKEKLSSAFDVNPNKIHITGLPRNDIIFKDIKGSDMFIKRELMQFQALKHKNKKILLYMPTFRDTGRDPFDIIFENKVEIDRFLTENNCIFVCKAHVCNNFSRNLPDNFILLDNSVDIYPMLNFVDILVTDYSSIYLDFLLTDKPIIFFPYDLEIYVSKDRSLYVDYDEYTPGNKAFNINDLLNKIKAITDGCDEHVQARKQLKDKMFVYQDGNSSKRTTDIIKTL